MLIGVPVAATPGLGPHDDVLVEPVLAVVLALVLELVALDAPLEPLEVLLLLLPQPASTSSAPTNTASTMLARRLGARLYTLTLCPPPRNDSVGTAPLG
jgi:hypothetical protein